MEEIVGLDTLIKPFVGDNVKITKCETRSLIPPGENYGSIMLAVDLVLNGNEKLHLVAKKCPTSEFIKQMFNIGVTFKKEVVLYKTVIPTLQAFQKRNGCPPLTSFVKYYGSRWSMDPEKNDVDDDCCLLLENIKVKGYGIEERMKGFNLDCTKFLLKDLAMFHAVPIAMKLKEPEKFKDVILKQISIPNYTRESFPEETSGRMMDEIIERVETIDKYKRHAEKIDKIIRQCSLNLYDSVSDQKEPFASVVHSDYWTNNTMIKLDHNGKIIANCFVDFQMLIYGNPFNDLMFFLYSSVEIPVLKAHYDEFLDFYYNTFIEVLRDLKVDNLEQFSKELYHSEIERAMKRYEMFHILFMLTPIYTRKEKATEQSEISEESLNDRSNLNHEKYYERLIYCLDSFVEKGWLPLNGLAATKNNIQ